MKPVVVMKPANKNNPDADQMFFEADQLINDKKVPEAMDLLKRLTERYPDYGRAYNHIGWIYEVKYGQYDLAEENYRKAMELDPSYKATYVNFSICLRDMGKPDDALDVINKGLAIKSTYKPTLYSTLASIYEQKGEIAKAIDEYKNALKLTLDLNEAYKFKDSIKRCELKLEVLK